ncbi:TetR family transcriptional regulator C-terminal domain-containing protein [Microbacterium sp. M28]|uniref:TetR/AcrR family transcriptional regulator n=1 Tax=Microbacterium sp. M28 TaxID=2962064 RepID=UPI0021F3CF0E|nr:TetR-like C-terminal domain-containing protein [Microbacterium sp. M28]UYO98087.1 TetR family transcriptional regulator C-terminal domain-containing protein [Microbacterium sp. M28]
MIEAGSKQETLRTRRVDSSDRRVLKTRRKLLDAFRRLVDADEVRTAGVARIVREAGTTRSSFYAHFSGIGDLAATALSDFSESLIAQARVAIVDGASKTAVNRQVLLDIARFIADHRTTYGVLLTSDPAFVEGFATGLTESVLITLRTRVTLAADPEVTARYIAAGTLAAISWWLTDGRERTAEELADALIAIAPPDLRD